MLVLLSRQRHIYDYTTDYVPVSIPPSAWTKSARALNLAIMFCIATYCWYGTTTTNGLLALEASHINTVLFNERNTSVVASRSHLTLFILALKGGPGIMLVFPHPSPHLFFWLLLCLFRVPLPMPSPRQCTYPWRF